jgi:hypothetical protein
MYTQAAAAGPNTLIIFVISQAAASGSKHFYRAPWSAKSDFTVHFSPALSAGSFKM